jgi:streptomycin 6-kinase
MVADCGFEAREELPGGHCSRVFADWDRVLKIPFQGEELTYGVPAALKLADAGGPRIFAYDKATGAVLMERLVPGSDLSRSDLGPEAREEVFCRLAARIARLDPDGAMPLRDYFEFEHPLLDRLEDATAERVFLHGDLHHANILFDGRDWRPIDPKGLCGDRHFECVAFLRNPIEELRETEDLLGLTRSRVASLAKRMSLDPWRIVAWGLLDRIESQELATDDPWRRLLDVYVELEDALRQARPARR